MKALVCERNLPRFAAARVASYLGSGRGARVGPLRLLDADPPALPDKGWHPVTPLLSGICGSDLATLDGRTSRYFEDLVSFPFVPGHEVVGTVGDGIGGEGAVDHAGVSLAAGARVVIEPVLGCAPRGIEPRCPACASGRTGACGHLTAGRLAPGLQTGYCAATGGGWSTAGLVAHASQLHAVPDTFTDEDAVVVEPTACAVHAALAGGITDGDTVAVLGAGTLGLATVAALHQFVVPATGCSVLVGAKHPHQRDLAARLGADVVVGPDHLPRAVRRAAGSLVVGGQLTSGADVVFDCVGSAASLTSSLALVRQGGTVVMVGMPGRVSVDLAPLWHREIRLAGAYAYGTERPVAAGHDDTDRRPRTFELAIELVAAAGLGELVTAAYPLDRFEEAVAHAGAAGRRGAVKIVFDLRHPKGRSR